MDFGWIWMGYIQDGLLVTFGPTEIAIGGPWGDLNWPEKAINQVFLFKTSRLLCQPKSNLTELPLEGW